MRSCALPCRRRNVKLETRAWVSKLRCDGRRVHGVDYVRDDAQRHVSANREVIVCAGTVNSPQLLQLSGIGPGAARSPRTGSTPLLDNPAVGGNLQDHLGGHVLL